MAASTRHVALLRGINVGRNKRIAMADLRGLLEGLGHTGVRTHLQSGNAIFTAAPGSGSDDAIADGIHGAIAAELKLDVDVLVRSRAEVAAVVRRDPLADVAADPARYLVVFLSVPPAKAKLKAIDAAAYEPERFAVHGRELYLWCPDGVHKAKLPKAFEAKGLIATARNWNTVTRLLELLDD